MKAMLLAAGLGTRLKPFTDKHPKALALVNGKSLLQRNVEYLASFGITDLIVNVHHFADQVVDALHAHKGWGSNISISNEVDEVLETGGGQKKAQQFFAGEDEAFVLMNADILTDLPLNLMIAYHQLHNPLATLATTNRSTNRYLLFDEANRLCGWFNEKTGERKGGSGNKKAFSGIHVISPAIFPLIKEEGKFSMIELYLRLCPSHTILAYDHSEGILVDAGRPASIAAAASIFK